MRRASAFLVGALMVGCAAPVAPSADGPKPVASTMPSSPAPVIAWVGAQAPGTVASLPGDFVGVGDVAVDEAGSYYFIHSPAGAPVAEVLKIAADGTRTPIASLFGYGAAELAVSARGTVFLNAYATNNDTGIPTSVVVKVGAGGALIRVGGESEGSSRDGIAVDGDDNVFVTDTYHHQVRRIAPDGTSRILAGGLDQQGDVDGPGEAARFNTPRGIAVGADGTVYVADTGNRKIKRIDAAGNVSTFATLSKAAPFDLVINRGGTLYAATDAANVIVAVTPDGHAETWAGDGTICEVHAVTPAYRVAEASPSPDPCSILIDGPRLASRFLFIRGLGIEPGGAVVTTDFHQRLRRITPD